jgi:hypothetical protein
MVEVEFKYDARDGRYKLLDVNARVWTWNALGSAAGVDFAAILWRLKMGARIEPVRGRPGAGWMHASRDLLARLHEVASGKLTTAHLARSWWNARVFAAYAKDDPLPGLLDLPIALKRLASPGSWVRICWDRLLQWRPISGRSGRFAGCRPPAPLARHRVRAAAGMRKRRPVAGRQSEAPPVQA